MRYAGDPFFVSTLEKHLLEEAMGKGNHGKHFFLCNAHTQEKTTPPPSPQVYYWGCSLTCLLAYQGVVSQGRMRIKGRKHAKKNLLTVGRRVLIDA